MGTPGPRRWIDPATRDYVIDNVERESANLLGSPDGVIWTGTGATPGTVTAGQADPVGGTDAWLLTDDRVDATEALRTALVGYAGGPTSFELYVKKAASILGAPPDEQWAAGDTESTTTGGQADPLGGTDAYLLTDDSATLQRLRQTAAETTPVALTASDSLFGECWFKKDISATHFAAVETRALGAGSAFVDGGINIHLGTGEAQTFGTDYTLISCVEAVTGWFRVRFRRTGAGVAGESQRMRVRPAVGLAASFPVQSVTATGGCTVYGPVIALGTFIGIRWTGNGSDASEAAVDLNTGDAQVIVGTAISSLFVSEEEFAGWFRVSFDHAGDPSSTQVAIRVHPARGAMYPTGSAVATGSVTVYAPSVRESYTLSTGAPRVDTTLTSSVLLALAMERGSCPLYDPEEQIGSRLHTITKATPDALILARAYALEALRPLRSRLHDLEINPSIVDLEGNGGKALRTTVSWRESGRGSVPRKVSYDTRIGG